nr:transposase [Streptomyces sp. NBC_01455]
MASSPRERRCSVGARNAEGPGGVLSARAEVSRTRRVLRREVHGQDAGEVEGLAGNIQALQQFVNHSPWDPLQVRRRIAQRLCVALSPEPRSTVR